MTLVGLILVLIGLLYPAVATALLRRRVERAFWDQVNGTAHLYDWEAEGWL